MPKKPTTKKRTKVKDLPEKKKRLSKGELKSVRGGLTPGNYKPGEITLKRGVG